MMLKDYQVRFMDEYNTLINKYLKLNKIINLYELDQLDFTLNCPIELLKEQSDIMWNYINVLWKRAEFENVKLNKISKRDTIS